MKCPNCKFDNRQRNTIVAVFGAPVRFENHAEQAVLCAIEMQRKMRELNNRRRKEGKVFFEMRIGLNSGIVVAGAIGCDLKLEYTSIGETTNLANRMEAKCKTGHVLMSENTYRLIKDKSFAGVFINNIPEKEIVKGYREEVNTYGIYVQDLKITKNMNTEDLTRFYEYETVSWEKS